MLAKRRNRLLPNDINIGPYVTNRDNVEKMLRPGMVLASLSDARIIQTRSVDCHFWIGSYSEEVGPGTFKGVPSAEGYYKDNGDGTFTSIRNKTEASRQELLYVTSTAAKAVTSGDRGPLDLEVWSITFYGGIHLAVNLIDGAHGQVVSVPSFRYDGAIAQSKLGVDPIPTEVIKDAGRQLRRIEQDLAARDRGKSKVSESYEELQEFYDEPIQNLKAFLEDARRGSLA